MHSYEPAGWQKSSYSAEGNNCIELSTTPDRVVHLRESDAPSIVLAADSSRVRALLALARRMPW